jgi:electron transfer flavoprotein alpha subunit
LRETTWEAIAAGRELAALLQGDLTCLLLGHNVDAFAAEIAKEVPKVLAVDDPRLEHFNSEPYGKVISALLADTGPYALIMGASNSIMDIAAPLSVILDAAFASDCFGFEIEDGNLFALRQLYNYKVNAKVSFKDSERIVLTLRGGAFSFSSGGGPAGEVTKAPCPLTDDAGKKRFVRYVSAEKGDVDIASADVIVSVGRGVGDAEDLDIFQSLADAMGGVLACSRPIVDKGLLPKYHQVGTSGIEVKPKIYLALGISGAFQHLGGIKGSPVLIAVNKDPKAPIFRAANYGVAANIFDIAPALEEKIREMKK